MPFIKKILQWSACNALTLKKAFEKIRPSKAIDRPRSEQMLKSVVDNVIDGIITIDTQGKIESFNPAAENIFGYEALEVIGRNVSMLMPEPFHSQHDDYLVNYLKTGERKIIGIGREVVGQHKNGSVFPMELAINEFHIGRPALLHRYCARYNATQAFRRGTASRRGTNAFGG